MYEIVCDLGFGQTNVNYLPYGTKGYLKTNKNEVRECVCLGGKWDKGMKYEWKVAGYKEHFFGTHSRIGNGEVNGIVYKNELSAQRGRSDTQSSGQIGEMETTAKVSIHNFLMRKYGLGMECFHLSGTWSNVLEIRTYGINKDHSVGLYLTDFEVILTKDGFDVIVLILEEVVDGKRRYPTKEKAYAAIKPLKVYKLDDEDEEDEKKPIKVKMTIEVELEQVEKVKAIGGVVIVKEG